MEDEEREERGIRREGLRGGQASGTLVFKRIANTEPIRMARLGKLRMG